MKTRLTLAILAGLTVVSASAQANDILLNTPKKVEDAILLNGSNIAENAMRIGELGVYVTRNSKEIRSVAAKNAALNALFQPYNVGKLNISAGVGGYKNQAAVAIGAGYRFNESVAVKAGIAHSHSSDAYNVGVNFEW